MEIEATAVQKRRFTMSISDSDGLKQAIDIFEEIDEEDRSRIIQCLVKFFGLDGTK